jgi:cytochrome P450
LFAPAAIDRLRPKVIQRFDDIMNEIVAKGECDYVADVALRFPNEIFMELFGMPTTDAEQFQVWETAILHGAGTSGDTAFQAMMSVNGYFAELIALKRRQPGEDIISYALTWEIDGEKISDEDLLAFCLLMFMAGLDTVAMQLSYSMYHLAINPDDRAKILADPDRVWPLAVEEFLRYYAFVTPGRKIMADTDFNGCPMKKGEMLWLPICSANRDPKAFDNADRVIVDREVNPHIAFGAGPHRCVGSYLARQELLIGLRGWHERIPNYRIDPSVKVIEHGGQMGLTNLPLIWDKK